MQWREHHDKSRDVTGTGKVQSAVAFTASEGSGINRDISLVIDVLRDPGHGAADPLIQSQLPKHILFCRIGKCLPVCIPDTVDLNGVSQGGICLVPGFLIIPVLTVIQSVNHRIEGRVDALALQDILCLGMILIADAVPVCTGRCNQEVQRLCSRIAGALGQDIHQVTVGLGMQLVQHQTGHIQSMLGSDFCRQHLIETHVGVIHQALGRRHDLGAFQECRGHFHHALGHIKDDACLLPVRCRAVHLR